MPKADELAVSCLVISHWTAEMTANIAESFYLTLMLI